MAGDYSIGAFLSDTDNILLVRKVNNHYNPKFLGR